MILITHEILPKLAATKPPVSSEEAMAVNVDVDWNVRNFDCGNCG